MTDYSRRWSDNDHRAGPFIYSKGSDYRPFTVMFSSLNYRGEKGNNLRLSAFGRTLIICLPKFINPSRTKVSAKYWDAATIERMGQDWYYEVHERKFGISCSEGYLQIKYGRSTDDSSTDRHKGYFLPWTQWRFTRHSLYDANGVHFWTEPARKKGAPYDFNTVWAAKEACPSLSFVFKDFDGEELTAKTRIEEREWKFGEGKFRWLSLFKANKVIRSLEIEFSGETGKRKGSWKGGTVGHSIEMLPSEAHEQAFNRYCDQHEMEFVGAKADR